MTLSLTFIGLLCAGLYFLLTGGSSLFGWKVNATLMGVLAFIAGLCILLGLFVTETLVLG